MSSGFINRQPLFWADRLRNLATVMVIAIHVSGSVAQGMQQFDSFFWWSGNFWDSLARPSVPLFVMLSGFLLLGKDYELGDFLKRRFSRVVIPALFWMVIYSFYNYKAHGRPATLGEAIKGIVERPVHYHLWFIYLIIGLYLIYPILRPWIRSARERDFMYFFVCWFVGALVYKILWVFFGISIGVYFELFTNNCGYFVLGYYLGNKGVEGGGQKVEGMKSWHFSEKKLVWLAIGLIVFGTGITAIGTWWASKANEGIFHTYFYDYLTPNCAMSAAGWFLLAKWTLNRPAILDFEKELAVTSFGIYFVHVLVMDGWSQVGYWQTKIHPAAGIPIVVCMITLTSFLAISIIRTLPGGQKIT
ncbi:MAG: acyltransferase family protein [Saprospiraceae bacterium]